MNGPCDAYCEHGGVCVLDAGHDGLHDSWYCQWDDEHSLSKDAADEILIANNPNTGPFIAMMDGVLRTAIANSDD